MEFTSPWDNHTVRMNNCNFATGKPSVLYALPALYGCEDYLSAVDPAEITLCADECVSKDELPGDEDLTELLHICLKIIGLCRITLSLRHICTQTYVSKLGPYLRNCSQCKAHKMTGCASVPSFDIVSGSCSALDVKLTRIGPRTLSFKRPLKSVSVEFWVYVGHHAL